MSAAVLKAAPIVILAAIALQSRRDARSIEGIMDDMAEIGLRYRIKDRSIWATCSAKQVREALDQLVTVGFAGRAGKTYRLNGIPFSAPTAVQAIAKWTDDETTNMGDSLDVADDEYPDAVVHGALRSLIKITSEDISSLLKYVLVQKLGGRL